jgi:PhnB protein
MAANATSAISTVQPYLAFVGRTEEALAFYERVLGAKVTFKMRFNESPEPCDPKMVPPGTEHKIMHCEFKIGESTLMATDGGCSEMKEPKFQGITLTIRTKTNEEAERVFNELGVGGQVHMPMVKTFFAEKFGMLQDRFGVSWTIIAAPKQ